MRIRAKYSQNLEVRLQVVLRIFKFVHLVCPQTNQMQIICPPRWFDLRLQRCGSHEITNMHLVVQLLFILQLLFLRR
jgi:hypothetical protein